MNISAIEAKFVWRGIVLMAITFSTPMVAAAQDPPWLRSIDELMSVEVTSAAKRERRLADTAAAVFVLTRDDIRRSGQHDVPGLLRLVPGVQVAQIDANKWAITVRGFNSRWANKLLVMIDGQSVYSDVLSGVYWDALEVPIELIERIEVVRGPGGSLWGANAVNGVINIITRTPTTRGGVASATTGSFGQSTGAFRYASPMGPRARAYGYVGAGDQDAIAPQTTSDNWESFRLGGGLTWDVSARDTLELQTAAHRSDTWATSELISLSAPLRPREGRREGTRADVLRTGATWVRTLRGDGSLQTSFAWTNERRDDGGFLTNSGVKELSFQHTAPRMGRHEVTWGAAFRDSNNELRGSDTFDINPEFVNQSQAGAFAQDEIGFASNRVVLTVGSKVERFTQTGWHLQPTLRALWNANARQSVWGAISRVVRTPSIVERGMVVDLFTAPGPMPIVGQLSGNPDLQEESLEAYEAGYRWTTSAVSLDLTGYVNQYAGAVTLWTGAPRFFGGPGGPYLLLPMMLTNDSNVSTAGGEALVTISASPRWRIVGGYNLFTWQSRLRPDAIATAPTSSLNTPRHQFTARSLFALPHGVDFDTTLYRVGAIETGHVPAYTRIDARLGWRVWSALDLSVLARNVLDSRHAEYGFQDAAVLFGRARRQLSVTTTWRF